ncbi:EAL domain-containing protein [Asticcacaulis sp. ZE23SCel15]|uniref:putative bifunctional diguanylate cyclase/phosphodiesterase n=1 Tax=Asticcacaulis sp. ZE23SCel15 TaxID=3059027 RepID=UPI0026603A4A|nr:EAL domain-containing protein [Asticcacaulis sp. ZE23SCel15]WKL56994.1 EAL domain-containing protein [Asticcacaulis sp. ZE23SCel15]
MPAGLFQGGLKTFFKGKAAPVKTEAMRREEVIALRPVVRGFALGVGVYYILITFAHLFYEEGAALWVLDGLAATTMAASFFFFHVTRNTQRIDRLEYACLVLFSLMYLNVVAYQIFHVEPAKLVYFVLLVLVFATAGITPRVIIPCALVCMVTMYGLAYKYGILSQYIWIGLAGIATAMGMSVLMRQAILRAVHARVQADTLRDEAQALANCDALTGLPNRRSFFDAMEQAVSRKRQDGKRFDLALIDLDGFKPVNDVYGHSVGDALLVAVAGRLRNLCAGLGFPARLGGDEFAIILTGMADEEELKAFGERLCETLREPYMLSGVAANISASVGFVRSRQGSGFTISQYLERADYALYYAKQNLRGAPVVFSQKHETELRDFGLIDQTLRSSDLEQELFILFQPQYDIVENRTISFEALARWNSPKLGLVRPDAFIKAAERSGLISQITLILLRKALAVVQDWPEHIRISFNLSTRDLRSSTAIADICEIVRDLGLDPRRIEFEITETAMLSDFDQACEALNRLKSMGCRIALDDFGSGYSSFSYIHRLPVNKIKIDRSFVVQLVKHPTAQKIIKTIIELCKNLHLDCVIEGVETETELAKLKQVGARYIQGFLFSKPLTADGVDEYLECETGTRHSHATEATDPLMTRSVAS